MKLLASANGAPTNGGVVAAIIAGVPIVGEAGATDDWAAVCAKAVPGPIAVRATTAHISMNLGSCS